MTAGGASASADERIAAALQHAAHLLPAQPPLHGFVHHNTLHAFQHLPFHQALAEATALYGTEPYQSEAAFAAHLAKGRIVYRDVEAVLAHEPGGDETLWDGGPRRDALWRFRLLHTFSVPKPDTVAWQFVEGELFRALAPSVGVGTASRWHQRLASGPAKPARLSEELRALWRVLREAQRSRTDRDERTSHPSESPRRAFGVDAADLAARVHPKLIRLAGAYLDQGVAGAPMPHREAGFLGVFRSLYAKPQPAGERWLTGLPVLLAEQDALALDALGTVRWAMNRLAIPEADGERFITESLLELRGWAGQFAQAEAHPEALPILPVPATLADFLAVQLTLELAAAASLKAEATPQPESGSADPDLPLVWEAFTVAQGLVLTAHDLAADNHATKLLDAVAAFGPLTRRRLLHEAYERHYREATLDSLAALRSETASEPRPPKLQAVFCMDDREESTRRHLEELSSDVDTYGYAGFFGVAMCYQGLDDVKPRALCPVNITPAHVVREVAVDEAAGESYLKDRKRRGRIGRFVHSARDSSLLGLGWSVLVGTLKLVPLVGLTLFPSRFTRVSHRIMSAGLERPRTRLALFADGGKDESTGLTCGYTFDEMANIVGAMLSTMGLAKGFAELVMIVGHGSSSQNNPHEAAYNCGATGGGRGGPNARAFALMANEPAVRELLKARGIAIPSTTWFVGAYHNTCDDSMDYYDLELLPDARLAAMNEASRLLAQACELDAHERCRRFESVPAKLELADALRCAEERAADLAQPRPECGHATNAVCVVGRRERTRGLYLDRRAFLISYDPAEDPNVEKLGKLLNAAGPVGAGISLEYYFSYVDPARYGAGSKLPHNISGLVGVMDGHGSDLRTGLPWQMVEIHEPMRLLLVVEATPAQLTAIAERYPVVAELVTNEWLQTVSMDPDTGAMHVFEQGAFVPYEPRNGLLPVVPASVSHYGGLRDNLPCARVQPEVAHVS